MKNIHGIHHIVFTYLYRNKLVGTHCGMYCTDVLCTQNKQEYTKYNFLRFFFFFRFFLKISDKKEFFDIVENFIQEYGAFFLRYIGT